MEKMVIPACIGTIDSDLSTKLGDDAGSEHHLYRQGMERRSDCQQPRNAYAGSTEQCIVAELDRHPDAELFEQQGPESDCRQATLFHERPEGCCRRLDRV